MTDEPIYDQNEFFNQEIDEQFGDADGLLIISGSEFRPSWILYNLERETYMLAIEDHKQKVLDDFKETVVSNFPSPVAYNYYRFENSYENEHQRLHFLRDTWEAIIRLVHALVVAEARHKGLNLKDAKIKFRDLLSDKLHDLLLSSERILEYAETQGQILQIATIVPKGLLNQIRNLNQTRNSFSHTGALSEQQSREIVAETLQEVVDILQALHGLKNIKVLKYLSQTGLRIRSESFSGYALTRSMESLELSATTFGKFSTFLNAETVIAFCDDNIFCLSPFVHFRSSPSGHQTQLLFLKKAKGEEPNRKLIYEVVGEAEEFELDRTVFKQHINDLQALCGLENE